MKRITLVFAAFIFISVFGSQAFSQTPAIRASVFTGDVVSIKDDLIVIKTENGDLDVQLNERTEFKRVPPENPTIGAAIASSLADIGVGDKLLVTGVPSNDRKSVPARAVYLMTKSDIAQKQARESEEWARRGISGRVVSVDLATNQITVEIRGLIGSSNLVINPKDDIVYKRYAQDSVSYSETIASSITNIQPGDTIRALGDKSPDGLSFAAEEVVTGAFQTVAGTVKSIDAERREVVITSFENNQDVVVVFGRNSDARRFPAEMAGRMAMMQAGGAPGAAPGGARPAGPPAGQAPAQAGGQMRQGAGQGMGGGVARGGIDDMFDRFPTIGVAELNPGDMIAVSSTKNGNAERITAIKLLAGIEPFVRAAQAAGAMQRGRGQAAGFTIPGLDGFDFPNF
jgi:hypothetical protein